MGFTLTIMNDGFALSGLFLFVYEFFEFGDPGPVRVGIDLGDGSVLAVDLDQDVDVPVLAGADSESGLRALLAAYHLVEDDPGQVFRVAPALAA